MQVIVLSNDLMFSSQLTPALSSQNLELRSCLTADAVVDACQQDEPRIYAVVLDLNMNSVDPSELAGRIAESPATPPLFAVGPHVHKAKLASAADAGWRVFTRGQFHADTIGILQSASSDEG